MKSQLITGRITVCTVELCANRCLPYPNMRPTGRREGNSARILTNEPLPHAADCSSRKFWKQQHLKSKKLGPGPTQCIFLWFSDLERETEKKERKNEWMKEMVKQKKEKQWKITKMKGRKRRRKEKHVVFWVMTTCSDVVEYQHFGQRCCLHLQGVITSWRYHPIILFATVSKPALGPTHPPI